MIAIRNKAENEYLCKENNTFKYFLMYFVIESNFYLKQNYFMLKYVYIFNEKMHYKKLMV